MSVYTITQSKLRGGRLSAELARHDPPEPVEFDRLSAFAKLSCDDMKSMNLEITALICLHVIRTSGSFSDRLCSSSLMAADSACCVCSILGLLSETRLVARAQSLSSACSAERNPKILHGVIIHLRAQSILLHVYLQDQSSFFDSYRLRVECRPIGTLLSKDLGTTALCFAFFLHNLALLYVPLPLDDRYLD